jgi:hypothetical protein
VTPICTQDACGLLYDLSDRKKETAMKRSLFAAVLIVFGSNVAFAANPACEAQATTKKLAGAAKASFTKKCVADGAAPK